jgi:ribosomal protein S18 acetylase RimI-like enzyme
VAEVEVLDAAELPAVRSMLVNLLDEEQRQYAHRQMSREEIENGLLGELLPTFTGDNIVLALRDDDRAIAAFCWLVCYDPGTGREGEVAEVYVRPDQRGRGLAQLLLKRAVALFQARGVTLGTVWTHPGNEAAIRLYRRAGFEPTEQLVLTWLPAGARQRR